MRIDAVCVRDCHRYPQSRVLILIMAKTISTLSIVKRVLQRMCSVGNDSAASAVGPRGVMRVDDKLFKLAYLSIFEKY